MATAQARLAGPQASCPSAGLRSTTTHSYDFAWAAQPARGPQLTCVRVEDLALIHRRCSQATAGPCNDTYPSWTCISPLAAGSTRGDQTLQECRGGRPLYPGLSFRRFARRPGAFQECPGLMRKKASAVRCMVEDDGDRRLSLQNSPVPWSEGSLWNSWDSAGKYPFSAVQLQQTHPNLKPAGLCAMSKAFSSMVFMLKTLQSYALQMRSALFFEDFQSLAAAVHREMQTSLLWLFQQVFAGTPALMIAVMLLFSDFTVHSATENLSLKTPECQGIGSEVCLLQSAVSAVSAPEEMQKWEVQSGELVLEGPSTMVAGAGGSGGRGVKGGSVFSGFEEGEGFWRTTRPGQQSSGGFIARLWPLSVQTAQDRLSRQSPPSTSFEQDISESEGLRRLLETTVEKLRVESGLGGSHVQLDQEIIRRLVAPVRVNLEEDDYSCFDRTELQYQEALHDDPVNPMLLSNFAQFLYIVRHDYDRAEHYFNRAMVADPTDGDILGRFATFLWLARQNREAAERAYKAAMASNPGNPYYSGSYAHFLWHNSEDDSACPMS